MTHELDASAWKYLRINASLQTFEYGKSIECLCSKITSRCAQPLGNVPNPVFLRPPTKSTSHAFVSSLLPSVPKWVKENRRIFIKRKNAMGTILFSHDGYEELGMDYDELKSVSAILLLNVMAYDYT